MDLFGPPTVPAGPEAQPERREVSVDVIDVRNRDRTVSGAT
jgi:hypothetical protein